MISFRHLSFIILIGLRCTTSDDRRVGRSVCISLKTIGNNEHKYQSIWRSFSFTMFSRNSFSIDRSKRSLSAENREINRTNCLSICWRISRTSRCRCSETIDRNKRCSVRFETSMDPLRFVFVSAGKSLNSFLCVVLSDMSHHYRINGSMIQQYTGKPVSIIGTVSKVRRSIDRWRIKIDPAE